MTRIYKLGLRHDILGFATKNIRLNALQPYESRWQWCVSWNTNQKSFIMHKWSQLQYTNELFPNSRELVILLLIASPLICSVALFLCTHKLAPLSLHAHFPALVFSFPRAHMVAPFRSSTICPLCSVTFSTLSRRFFYILLNPKRQF